MGQGDVRARADVFEMSGIHGARYGLHARGMAEYPGDGDGGLADGILFSNLGQGLVELRIFGVVHEAALEHARLQGRPGLYGDILQAAVVDKAVVAVYGALGGQVVDVQARVDQLGLVKGELQLVDDQGLLYVFAQQLKLAGGDVAHAEVPYLALGVQGVERLRHLLGLVQQVGTVQQQHVQVVGPEP